MKEQFQLKIVDILKRNHFENASVIAGHHGMERIVKWVHVVEVTSIRNLLKGQELILSTGVAWKDNPDLFVSMVKEFIEHHAAGLCIELGTYLTTIPDEVIHIANEHQFPIIIFQHQVPFVEITQDIHSVIINQQYQKISDLENYSQRLNKRLLTIESYEDILQFIFSALDVQIIFRLKNQAYEFVPELPLHEQASIIEQLERAKKQPNHHFAIAPIDLFGQDYGELAIYSKDIPISEYDLLILDRTATALAQHLLRELYTEEKKRVNEFEWLHGWLAGEHTLEEISDYLIEHGCKSKSNQATVLITKLFPVNEKSFPDVTYLKLVLRSVFEQNGFIVFFVEKRYELTFILLNQRGKKNMKDRIKKAIVSIEDSEFIRKQFPNKFFIAAGKFTDSLNDLHKSFQTAKETLRIQQKMTNMQTYYFYEDLHLYRLISQLSKQTDLQELASEYLQPVIQYDLKYNAKLLETLKAYLECNGSKQETANKLYIVRQTLYHRLQKLENLLGADFMEREKRVAIEFMLLVHDYLAASNLDRMNQAQ
ncbi:MULTISPECIES: PucR family transcriptional regulator [Neobacillus]|jgi:PucR family transcriptional regulator, purine catabolism regulatory protein|uniref:PucR family transcriptional regulator ligand-binding domain-containing protein n=1 Tax=Neobacillus sedimentimangrovi TaxID=2699460 RepID=A0ABS8QEL8_9BACI|nr:PucR family transcriptional regulator [Neobacillus sedimentimangrovi]AIM15076.1 PucR family transcriptional regulator [Bacillus sp. X1(2014)]MCD4837683.1 PucR family transcriptional regulator ligand-binding domain-containing protein [Neobacillus sedimentimangrovi]